MALKLKKERVNYIFINIYVFFVFFSPPILPHINIIVAIFSLLVLTLKFRKSFTRILIRTGMLHWVCLWCLFYIWWIAAYVINLFLFDDMVQLGHYVSIFNKFTVLIFVVVLDSVFLFCLIEKYNYNRNDFIKVVINAGLIESVMSVLAFISPAIKSVFIRIMLMNTNDSLYNNYWYTQVRAFGFAGTLVDVFGLGVAIIAAVSFAYGVCFGKRYIFYSLVVAISTVLNSRTGIVLYAGLVAIICLYIFFKKNSGTKKIRILAGTIILCIAVVIGIGVLQKNEFTSAWIKDGFDSLIGILREEEDVGDFGAVVLKSRFWELPEGIRLLLGTGHSRYMANGYLHTDNGYVNDIWLVGILGCTMLYGGLLLFILKCFKGAADILDKMILIILLMGFLIFNFKASVFAGNIGGVTFFFILFSVRYFEMLKKRKI